MGDRFYRCVRFFGSFGLWVSSRPLIRGLEHVPRTGPFILAATHQSVYDVPLLIRHTPRLLDFVSITEVFAKPLVGWFYGSLNAFPLERSRADPATVRIILDRLERGRAVAMFPEGRIRSGPDSVVHTGTIRAGVGRLATMANVPVVPCVIHNSNVYERPASWAPLRRTSYGIAYGEPMLPTVDPAELERQLVRSLQQLWAAIAKPE
ncbi:MAG TPA: lysophospholipid acyltransferase family protein [Phycisphaerales bacterium]|nr:lysophospholipid acyltransferase family protein [Phycisphaerales bacterium]